VLDEDGDGREMKIKPQIGKHPGFLHNSLRYASEEKEESGIAAAENDQERERDGKRKRSAPIQTYRGKPQQAGYAIVYELVLACL